MPNSSVKRIISPCLTRYVTCGFAVPFCCALLGFTALFLLNDVFDDIGDFLGKGVPLTQTILYFLAKQPGNLTSVMPISVLLGASFMTLMMGRHNELTAMRAAGLSLSTCALPVWIGAIIACAAVFAINESWGPACAKKALQIDAKYVSKNKLKHKIAFHHPKEKRDWTIEAFNPEGTSKSVTIRQYRQDNTNHFLLSAQTASFNDNSGWTFNNGFIQYYDKNGNTLAEQQFFKSHNEKFPESPSDIGSHSLKWELMNIRELLAVQRGGIVSSPRFTRLVKVLLWHKFAFPLASIVAALFGFALTISTDRMGPMRGFACAVGILVLFHIAGEFGMVLSKNGWLSPFLGGAAPSLAFIAAGIWTMWKKQ